MFSHLNLANTPKQCWQLGEVVLGILALPSTLKPNLAGNKKIWREIQIVISTLRPIWWEIQICF